MKKLGILLLVAAGLTGSLLEATKEFPCHKKNICCDPKPLPAPIQGLILIFESGAYRLSQNITAPVIILAHDVCVDLNGFTIQPLAASFAIFCQGFNNITVKNGTVKNPNNEGILLIGCNQINLENLKLNPVGQAISMINCTNGCLTDIDASGNTTSFHRLIRITNGHTFSLTRVNVSDNIVTRTIAPAGFVGLVEISGTDNVTMSCSKINRNTCTDRFVFFALEIFAGDSISIEDSEFNDNKVTFQGISNGIVTAYIGLGRSCSIKRCQFNRTTIPQSFLCYGLVTENMVDILIDACEANDSTIGNAVGILSLFTGATGILGNLLENFKIVNCTAHNTTHTANQPNQNEFSGPEGLCLLQSQNGIVKHCQANGTKSLGPNAQFAAGLQTFDCTNVLVCQSEARHTQAKTAYGFAVIAQNTNVTITDSIGSDTTGTFFSAGFVTLPFFLNVPPSLLNQTITFTNDCADNNLAPNSKGYGFALAGNTRDCTVNDSQAQGNSGAGIRVGLQQNPAGTHTNPRIVRNCAQENGSGIIIDGQNSTMVNALVFENKAIKNTNCGFEELGNPTVPTTYLGNKAQGNHPDFCGITDFEVKKKDGKLCCDEKSDHCFSDDLANISLCPQPTPVP